MPEKKRKSNSSEDCPEGMFTIITDPLERLKLLARRFPELAEKYGPALEEAARHVEEEKSQAEDDQAKGEIPAEE